MNSLHPIYSIEIERGERIQGYWGVSCTLAGHVDRPLVTVDEWIARDLVMGMPVDYPSIP